MPTTYFPNSNNCILIFSKTESPQKVRFSKEIRAACPLVGLHGTEKRGSQVTELTTRELPPSKANAYFNNVIFFVAVNPSAWIW